MVILHGPPLKCGRPRPHVLLEPTVSSPFSGCRLFRFAVTSVFRTVCLFLRSACSQQPFARTPLTSPSVVRRPTDFGAAIVASLNAPPLRCLCLFVMSPVPPFPLSHVVRPSARRFHLRQYLPVRGLPSSSAPSPCVRLVLRSPQHRRFRQPQPRQLHQRKNVRPRRASGRESGYYRLSVYRLLIQYANCALVFMRAPVCPPAEAA